MTDRVSASAPATAANLGPGFDCVGLALAPRCTVSAQVSDVWAVEHVGEYKPPPGEGDAVLAAARHTVGDRPLSLVVDTHIPMGKGIGSSAAAYVAGVAAALRALGEDAAPDRVFRHAAELEGHADQVGAAVYGGLVVVPAEGLPIRFPLHPSLRPVIAIPETRLPTHKARAILPESYSMETVVRSLGRMSTLTAGLITGDAALLAASHGDEIHEAPRADLSPEVGHMMEVARRAGALHAARSGAGPSVIAITTAETADNVADALKEDGAEVINEPIDTVGLV
ncbi:MAG: homoserine kinase [Actinomycetota bacterium]|nr:homoserine kinase [Actinomycetota bacterium]